MTPQFTPLGDRFALLIGGQVMREVTVSGEEKARIEAGDPAAIKNLREEVEIELKGWRANREDAARQIQREKDEIEVSQARIDAARKLIPLLRTDRDRAADMAWLLFDFLGGKQ